MGIFKYQTQEEVFRTMGIINLSFSALLILFGIVQTIWQNRRGKKK